MMTIKEFADLCKCNTQTLRYYDRIGLLKPVKVDQWSGYRYYTQSQAIDFVKIKNLQVADFTIDEIKVLLTKPDQQVYDAFGLKIAEQEQKLKRITEIQQSYLKEKNNMETLIQGLSDFLLRHLTEFDGLREFGLEPEDSQKIVNHIRTYLNRWMLDPALANQDVRLMVNEEIICGPDRIAERINSFNQENLPDTIILGGESVSEKDAFDPEQFETLWECHNWDHVHEFIDAIPKLEHGKEYCFLFRMKEGKYKEDISFPMFMLGAMVVRKGESEVCMGCSVEKSSDMQNHFLLMRKK